MKEKNFLAALLLIMAGVQTAWSQSMKVWQNGEPVEFDVNSVDSVTFTNTGSVDPSNHQWVDFGLPSGTLWATCNVGADKPEAFGEYFAWGETETKDDYLPKYYKYFTESTSTQNSFWIEKYCTDSSRGNVDNKTELEAVDDAASVKWGSEWQTPSKEQWEELLDERYTVVSWGAYNNVIGMKIRKKDDPETAIFLPAAGAYRSYFLWDEYAAGVSQFDCKSYYWSRSLDTNNMLAVSLTYSYMHTVDPFEMSSEGRVYGLSVRPVRVQDTPYEFQVKEIQLNKTEVILSKNSTVQLEATVLPEYAKNKELAWESSDESVARVENGLVTALSEGECTITCRATDGSGVFAECEVEVNGHPYVDLGLPSGTLWATCNVGAASPEGYGFYFAWGETEPKKTNGAWDNYSWGTYKWMNPGQWDWTQINKYTFADNQTEACWYDSDGTFIGDGNTMLFPEDDAATANWGRKWQMPTVAQFEELFDSDNTTSTWTTKEGVNGRLVTSIRNNASIFLPAAGRLNDIDFAGTYGFYWTNMLDGRTYTDRACNLPFDENKVYVTGQFDRYSGQSVRPVRVRKVVHVQEITLNEGAVTLSTYSGPKTVQLVATVLPENADNRAVKWESSDTSVAVVSEDGLVTAKFNSNFILSKSCTITCSALDGSGVKASCRVTIDNSDIVL